MFPSMDKLVRINGLARFVLLRMFVLLTFDVHQIQADDTACVDEDCKTTMSTCHCPSESPPCSVVGLAIANVLVVTPLLIVYLFFPVCCCFYSCRKRTDDSDKPPQIEQAPPQFSIPDPRFSRRLYSMAIVESDGKEDTEDDEHGVFQEDTGKDNGSKKGPIKNIQFTEFNISEDQRSLDNNSLIDFEETTH